MPAGGNGDGPIDFYRPEYLFGCAAAMILYLGVAVIVPTPVLEAPLGLAELLFVPGYAVGAVLFPGRSHLPWSASLAIVAGLSVAINIFLGLGALRLHDGLPPPLFATVASALALVALWVRLRSDPVLATEARQRVADLGRMAGFTAGQRRGAFFLLAATAVVLVAIVYLSSVHPNVHPSETLALEGPGGSVATLPTTGSVRSVLAVWVSVTNGGAAQQLLLNVQSVNLSTNPAGYHLVPWSQPLALGNATQSSTAFNLLAAQTYVLNFTFSYSYPGVYAIYLTLSGAGGATARTAALTVQIT